MASEITNNPAIKPEETADLARLFNIVTRMIEHGRPRPEGCPHGPGHGPEGPGPRQHGMHPGKHRALAILAEKETMTQKELLDELSVSASALSEMLSKLEAHELITRKRDEDDKRSIIVSITEKGAVRYAEAELVRAERHKKLFAALSAEEQEQLGGLLAKLINAWHEDPAVLAEMAPRRHRGHGHKPGCGKSPAERAQCHGRGGRGGHGPGAFGPETPHGPFGGGMGPGMGRPEGMGRHGHMGHGMGPGMRGCRF